MKKLWRHKQFDFDAGMYPRSSGVNLDPYPEPEIYAENSPGSDYDEFDDYNTLVAFKAATYDKKKEDGLAFSATMNARLDLLSPAFFTTEEMTQLKAAFATDEDGVIELGKDAIDSAFEKTQWFLEGGKWKSAQREIVKVDVNSSPFLKQETIDEIKLSIDTYVQYNY